MMTFTPRHTICILVLGFLVTQEVTSECNFPDSWSNKNWMTRRNNPDDAQYDVIKYDKTKAYATDDMGQIKTYYTCEFFEIVNNHHYYIRESIINDVTTNKTCVVDSSVNNVILHREYAPANANISMASCKTALQAIDVYSVYVQVSFDESSRKFTVQTFVDCPLPQIPFQVSYNFAANLDATCREDENSVLTINKHVISILACKYINFPRVPLTGTIKCNSLIPASELGESGDANGGIIVMQWQTRTTNTAFVYCARYKTIGQDAKLSIDITSTDELACKSNAKYDWYSTKDNRNYVLLNLNYRSSLVSGPPVKTTPRFTLTPILGSTTTSSTIQDIMHVQFMLDLPFTETPNDRKNFTTNIRDRIASVTENLITQNHFDGESIFVSSGGRLVITMDLLTPGMDQINGLRGVVNTKEFVVQKPDGTDVNVLGGTFYNWRDDDKCSEKPCANNGTCWVLQGVFKCRCPSPYTVPYCDIPAVPYNQSSSLSPGALYGIIGASAVLAVVVIIVIVVVVMRKQKKSKQREDSETGYDNKANTINDFDREMYSTINKKPKAFHDKSFVGEEEKEHGGELTGIHL